jgi:hypothetical protein
MSRKKKFKEPDKTQETPNISKGVDFTRHKSSFKSIRTSIKSIIKDSATQKKLNDLVIRINDIVIDTYQFIKLLSYTFLINLITINHYQLLIRILLSILYQH